MSVKSKVLAAAAALTLVGGGGAVGVLTAGTAGAATPSCGSSCVDIFSHNLGTYPHPNFVLDVLRQGEKVGQPIILFRASSSDPAEDFTVSDQTLVSAFYAAGLVSSSLALHYGGLGCEDYDTGTATCVTHYPDDDAFELEYTPYGVDSGLCMGTAAAAVDGSDVSLQPCDATARTIWIVGLAVPSTPPAGPPAPAAAILFDRYAALINGSGSNFSQPYVLTYPQNSYPAGLPRPQLTTRTLDIDSHGVTDINQMWGDRAGILP
jgi:hypothetical protein